MKPRRAEKLSGGVLDQAEVETLRKVARGVRGEAERVDEPAVQTLRQNLNEFFVRLQDPTLPPINPVKQFREMLGCNQVEMAAATSYSLSRWAGIEAGGIRELPKTFLGIVTDMFGPSAPAVFERSWNRYRASLSESARRAVELKLFPFIGSGFMAP